MIQPLTRNQDYKSPHIIPYIKYKIKFLKWHIQIWYKEKSKYNLAYFPCQDGEIVGWWYGEPDDKDFIEVFGWKYKLLKHFKRKDKK